MREQVEKLIGEFQGAYDAEVQASAKTGVRPSTSNLGSAIGALKTAVDNLKYREEALKLEKAESPKPPKGAGAN